MRRVFAGLSLVLSLAGFVPIVLAAPSDRPGKTIKNLSDAVPLRVLERSVGPKFYQSLLVSPLADWSVVRARLAGSRLRDARIIRSSTDPVYNSMALKVASELTLVSSDLGGKPGRADAAQMHLFIYKIADGLMAVSFAYPEVNAPQQHANLGTVRVSIKTTGGTWAELTPSDREDKRASFHDRERRLRRMDRMPMDVISVRQ